MITFDKDISIIKSDEIDNSFLEYNKNKSKSSINMEKYMYIFSDNRDNIFTKKQNVSLLDYEGDIPTNYMKRNENFNASFNKNVILDE